MNNYFDVVVESMWQSLACTAKDNETNDKAVSGNPFQKIVPNDSTKLLRRNLELFLRGRKR